MLRQAWPPVDETGTREGFPGLPATAPLGHPEMCFPAADYGWGYHNGWRGHEWGEHGWRGYGWRGYGWHAHHWYPRYYGYYGYGGY